ncbi:MAG: DUF5694 domain-containing protein [Pseudomonadota bacterium]
MARYKIAFAILSITLLAAPIGAVAQDRQPSKSHVEIMILGVNHFTGSGPDATDPDVPYYLGADGQKEVRDVLDRLETYAPDKIMIELNFEREVAFNQTYNSYIAGNHELTVNERQQIGMRLARRLGHEKLYAMDFTSFLDYRPALAAAEELGQEHLLDTVETLSAEIGAGLDEDEKLPLKDRLIRMNSDDQRLQRKIFLTIAQMGTAEDPQGALQIQTWWQRNLVMFARTAQRTEPGDKVLIVVGNGHREILEEFFAEAPGFELVSPISYLAQ